MLTEEILHRNLQKYFAENKAKDEQILKCSRKHYTVHIPWENGTRLAKFSSYNKPIGPSQNNVTRKPLNI